MELDPKEIKLDRDELFFFPERKNVFSAKNHQILIVEDSKLIVKQLTKILESYNYKVIAAVDHGEDAIDIIKSKRPDLVIMDISLRGGIDGVETVKKINSFSDVPVIFLTGSTDIKNIERIKETVPYGYLTKPFKGNDLYYTIETSLLKYEMISRIRESEERLNAVWNNIQTAIIMIDVDTDIIVSVNPKASEIISQSSESIIS